MLFLVGTFGLNFPIFISCPECGFDGPLNIEIQNLPE